MLGKSDAEMLKGDAPFFAPGMALEQVARHSIDFWITSEDLPDLDNRVTLDGKDRITIHYTPNNMEGHQRLTETLKTLLVHAGREHHLLPNYMYLSKTLPVAGAAHQNGTIRFGRDPLSSALDVNCKAHDLDNLYVVDSSFFVSSAAVNPGLTVMANALRVGDHLLDRLR